VAPISGAPRTRIVRIASTASSRLAQCMCGERVRQPRLVDDPGEALLRISPDAAMLDSVDFHARGYTIAGLQFPGAERGRPIYDFNVTTIDGKRRSMSKYKGKVMLIVNTASECA
jgi:hypothetical protein